MRWKVRRAEVGDERTVNSFLLFPRTIMDETRWLERVKIRQVYSLVTDYTIVGSPKIGKWVDKEWK